MDDLIVVERAKYETMITETQLEKIISDMKEEFKKSLKELELELTTNCCTWINNVVSNNINREFTGYIATQTILQDRCDKLEEQIARTTPTMLQVKCDMIEKKISSDNTELRFSHLELLDKLEKMETRLLNDLKDLKEHQNQEEKFNHAHVEVTTNKFAEWDEKQRILCDDFEVTTIKLNTKIDDLKFALRSALEEIKELKANKNNNSTSCYSEVVKGSNTRSHPRRRITTNADS